MRRRAALAGLLAALSLAGVGAGPADAAGPYEPFKEGGDPRERSNTAVDRLNDRLLPGAGDTVTPEQLEEGVVVRRQKRRGKRAKGAPVVVTGAEEAVPTQPQAAGGNDDGLFSRAGLSQPADQPTPDVAWLVALAAALALAAAAVELRRMRPRRSL